MESIEKLYPYINRCSGQAYVRICTLIFFFTINVDMMNGLLLSVAYLPITQYPSAPFISFPVSTVYVSVSDHFSEATCIFSICIQT